MDDSISSFLCRESEEFLDGDDQRFVGDGWDDEYLQMMFDREVGCHGLKTDGSSLSDCDWIKCARSEAVTWILKSRDVFGFRFQTACLSVMYLDQFISKRSIDGEKPWAIWLLAVACLSLAVKMEETSVPLLSDLQSQVEHFHFRNKIIQRMELLVLNTLEWRMRLVTPFAFLHYFLVMLCKEHRRSEVMSKTVGVMLAMMREVSFVDHRPSTIAAAALMASDNDTITKQELECKMKSNHFHKNLDTDAVFSCYSQMRRLEKQEEIKMDRSEEWPTATTTTSLSMSQLKPVHVSEVSAETCEDGRSKRKRPSGDDDDRHSCGSPDDKRRLQERLLEFD